MERETELIERALAEISSPTEPRPDTELRSPVERYVDAERYAAEMGLFRRVAHVACAGSQLSEPGAFRVVEIAGRSILVVRQEDGSVRAFHNVCRHRGTQLVDASAGCKRRFSCPYHAWTYGMDGALVAMPHEHGFPTTKDVALAALPCEERHGLVWVGALDLCGLDLAGLALVDAVAFEPFSEVYRCNWKLLVEGGLEAYHFRVAHAKTIAPLFENNVFVSDSFGPHFRTVLPKRSIRGLADVDRKQWSLRDHANVLYTVFPTSAFILQSDHVAWIRFIPRAIDETEVSITLLVPRDEAETRAAHWGKNRALTVATLEEDFVLAESIQKGLSSGANQELIFGRFEHLLDRFHRQLEEMIRAERSRQP